MLQDLMQLQEQLPKEEISSPFSAQMLEFCDPELFPETVLQNSEVPSPSNCGYGENSCYTASLSLPPDIERFNSYQDNNNGNNYTATTSTATSIATANTINNNNTNLSIIFDSQDEIDNDISASIDFSPPPAFSVSQFVTNQQDQLDLLSLQPQIQLSDVVDGLSQYPADPISRLMGPPLRSVFEEDCLSSVPSYVPLNPPSPSCSFLGPAMGAYMPSGPLTAALSADNSGFVAGSSFMGGPELQPQDLEFQGDNGGIFCPNSIQRMFNHGELQALTQLVGGVGSSAPLATEISSLEDSSFKVGKLSVEQRKEKIHRYMKKRNERNFNKKIKYACRKTLADSRPRVRGRFAKNDEFGEPHRNVCSNHEEDDDDEVGVKEEDDIVDSSDIFAHISGVKSFKCNYSLQSWIG